MSEEIKNNTNNTNNKTTNPETVSKRVEQFLKGNKPKVGVTANFKLSNDSGVKIIRTFSSDNKSQIRRKFDMTNNNLAAEKLIVETPTTNITVKDLYDHACQFGHRPEITHANMKPYIYGILDKRTIINLDSTLPCLQNACKAAYDIAANGGKFLFVGTKSSIKAIIEEIAKSIGAHYITKKWKAGTLTNFYTMLQSLRRIEDKKRLISNKSNKSTKKDINVLKRQISKKEKESIGILNMRRLPQALIVVDTGYESIAVAEANKLGIPVIGIVDTNNNPLTVKYPIYSNDDSRKPVEFLLKRVSSYIVNGIVQSQKGANSQEKRTFSQEKRTFSEEKRTFSQEKRTFSEEKRTFKPRV